MAGVNLLPHMEAQAGRSQGLKRRIYAVTTAVVVVYVVGAAAGAGWWWYGFSRRVRTSAEVASLQAQLSAAAQKEVWLRLLADRSQAISTFLQSRSDLAGEAGVLASQPQVTVIGWDRREAPTATVQARAADSAALEDYARFLARYYDGVTIQALGTVTDGGGWAATISLGIKKL